MGEGSGTISVLFAAGLFAIGCAHSADTVVHVSAPDRASWEVRDADGDLVCALPCSVELDERESVRVWSSDGRTRFVLRQENLGKGAFSASIRLRPRAVSRDLAARAFAAALSGAGSVLAQSDDRGHVAAGAFLSGMSAAVLIASEESRRGRAELWVQRTVEPAD